MRRQHQRRADDHVIAVQLALDTEGFRYRKWGAEQRCKAGDWLVNRRGDVYTVEREIFALTYREIQPGQYRKVTPVWAEPATGPGAVQTLEGTTHYVAGDYLIYDDETSPATHAVSAATFPELYEPVPHA